MPDVNTVGVTFSAPGSEDFMRELLTKNISANRGEEGCQLYQLFESVTQPGTFIALESWRDDAAFEAHNKSEHIQAAWKTTEGHRGAAPIVYRLRRIEP